MRLVSQMKMPARLEERQPAQPFGPFQRDQDIDFALRDGRRPDAPAEAHMAEHGAAALGHAVHFALLDLEALGLRQQRQHLGNHDDALAADADDQHVAGVFSGIGLQHRRLRPCGGTHGGCRTAHCITGATVLMQSTVQTCAQSVQPMHSDGSICTLCRPSNDWLAPGDRRTAEIHAGLTGIALLLDDRERRALDLDRVEHARAVGDQHGDAAIVDGVAQRLMHGGEVVGIDLAHPFDADRAHQRFVVHGRRGLAPERLAGAGMLLAAGHRRNMIVEQHHRDVGLVVDRVDELRNSGMQEGRVADGGDDRLGLAGLGHADGVADRRAHRHGRVHAAQRIEARQGVAADIAGDARAGRAHRHERRCVRATGAQHRRTHQRLRRPLVVSLRPRRDECRPVRSRRAPARATIRPHAGKSTCPRP